MRVRPVDVEDLADPAVVVDQVGGAAIGAGQPLDGAGEDLGGLGDAGGLRPLDEHLADHAGGGERLGAGLAGPRLLDDSAEVGTRRGREPADVLGERPHLGAVEGQDAGEVRGAPERDGEA